MKIVHIAPPFKLDWLGKNRWETVPPRGYGGIQWIIKNLMDGLNKIGVKNILIGAPGSKDEKHEIVEKGEMADIEEWLFAHRNSYDVIHDHSCRGEEFGRPIRFPDKPVVHSHYLNSRPAAGNNLLFASAAHARGLGYEDFPYIPHPVEESQYIYSETKQDYLLFMGRVSPWKGTYEAALFAKKAGKKLIIAGPTWEKYYFDKIVNDFSAAVEYIGEVGGIQKKILLSSALAVLAPSQAVLGPNGKIWSEPGAQIVSEAAISGAAVISTDNGCLKEIVPPVGIVCGKPIKELNAEEARAIIRELPKSEKVHNNAQKLWSGKVIAEKIREYYKKVLEGDFW